MAPDFGKLILDETPDAVIVTKPDGEVVCWTQGARAVFGYSEAEALGRVLAGLIAPPGKEDGEQAVLAQALAQGHASYESMRRAKDGTLVYIDSSSKAVRNGAGRIDYILWSKKDVTQLKVLRDAKLAEARFGDVFESTPDAVIMANAGGRVVLANSHAEALFGYAAGELRGQPLELLMPARLRAAYLRDRAEFLGDPPQRPMGAGRALYGLRKDGKELPVEISLSPVAIDAGTLIMIAIRDTTERKRFERALSEKNLELAIANRAKDRFLASMSHELRTPLNAIIGFAGAMLMKLPGPLTAEQDRQLRTIQSSARHLLATINDLLELTRIASGKVELNLERLPYRALIDELMLVFQPQARQKGLALHFHAPAAAVMVRSDRRALQQILANLLNNAIKFTDNGEVRIALGTARLAGRACATVSVSDTGVGIAPESQAMLFQAFSQLDEEAARQFEGAGLGLHLSSKLAGLLNGRILCESRRGEGSVFTLAVPLE